MDKMTKTVREYYQSRYYQQQKRYSKELAWAIEAQRRLEDFEKKKEE
jgi:hypothetical protein